MEKLAGYLCGSAVAVVVIVIGLHLAVGLDVDGSTIWWSGAGGGLLGVFLWGVYRFETGRHA